MRIVLDAMGSDTHPNPELEACVLSVQEWPDPITLVGPEQMLQPALTARGLTAEQVLVVHAPEVLEMTDKPAHTARDKAMTSMAVGMDLLKDGTGDAFVTAGNTGGVMATALFRLGRIRGVKRPALAPVFPVLNGKCVVIDIGANVDCKPDYLLQFAILGTIYAHTVLGVSAPRVGLLSNGEEPGKGNELIQACFPLLASSGLDFIGNVEPKEVYAGRADVVVTDGFYGNIFLKTSEAVARFLMQLIRDHIKASPLTTLGGLLARPAFRRVAKIMDPSEYGAVPLLGVQGLVFIGHGRSDAKAIVSAIRVAREAVRVGLLREVEAGIRSRLPGAPTSD